MPEQTMPPTTHSSDDAYRQAGVDLASADAVVGIAKRLAATTDRPGLKTDIGGATPVSFDGTGVYSRQANAQTIVLEGSGRVRERDNPLVQRKVSLRDVPETPSRPHGRGARA